MAVSPESTGTQNLLTIHSKIYKGDFLPISATMTKMDDGRVTELAEEVGHLPNEPPQKDDDGSSSAVVVAAVDEGTGRRSQVCISPAPPEAASEDAADAHAVNADGVSPTNKSIVSPETPLWRFVANAKKREGYSSMAAGTVVTGM
jgi:hypothetical protein